MEQEQYYYNLFMAQQEKRRAAKSAAKRNQILNGQYRSVRRNSPSLLDNIRDSGFYHSGGDVPLRKMLQHNTKSHKRVSSSKVARSRFVVKDKESKQKNNGTLFMEAPVGTFTKTDAF